MSNLLDYLKGWITKPLDPNGNAWQWGLFVLLIIIFCLIWAHVISFFGKAAKSTLETV